MRKPTRFGCVYDKAVRERSIVEPLEQRITPASLIWIAGDGNWNNPANWSISSGMDADGIPDADDDVIIDPGGDVTVTITDIRSVQSLLMPGDDNLAITAGSLTVSAASTIHDLTLGNAALVGTGLVTLTGSGTLNTGATFFGNIRNEGTLLATGGVYHLRQDATFDNAGTFQHAGGRIDFNDNDATFNNLAGGIYNITMAGDSAFVGNFSSSENFNNAGILRHDATGTARLDGVTFNNLPGGQIEAVNGGLLLNGGGVINGGNFIANADGVISFGGGNFTIHGALTGTGTGIVRTDGGTLTGGTEATLNFPAGLLRWNDGGTLFGTVTNLGSITISSGVVHLRDQATFNNAGTITQTGGRLDFNDNNPTLNNLEGALYEVKITGDASFVGNFSNNETFNNAGTLRRDGSGVAAFGQVTFHNNGGIIEAISGTLQINAPGSMTGATLNASTGASINLAGIDQTWTGVMTGAGAGTVQFNNGIIHAGPAGLTLDFPTDFFVFSSEGNFNSGVVTNIGSITIGSGVTHLRGTLNNAGTITQVAGRLDFNDDGNPTLNNLAGAVYAVQIPGDASFVGNFSNNETFNNAGTLRRDGSGVAAFGQVTFHNNGGVIEALNGTLQINAPGSMTGATLSATTGATISLAGINQTWTGAFSGTGAGSLQFNNGTIHAGAGGVALNFPANFLVISSEANFGSGTFTNNGAMSIGSGVTHLRGMLNNAGTITQVGGRLDFNDDGTPTLNNLAGALYEVRTPGDASFIGNFSNNESFNNAGTLRRDGIGNAAFGQVTFHNNGGVIEAVNGTLQINAPGSMTGATLNAATGAAINLAGINQTWTGGITGSGGGSVQFNAGTITPGGAGVVLNFPAGFFVSSNESNFGAGVVTNTGAMTIGAGVTHLRGTLNNAGVITQLAGRLDFNDDGNPTLNNLSGGVYEVKIAGDASFIANFSNNEQFNNAGTLRRDGSGVAAFGQVTFHNTGGTIEAVSGTLQINAPGTMSGATFNVNSGSTVNLAGINQTWTGVMTGAGAGTVQFNNGIIHAGPGGVALDFPTDLFVFSSEGNFNSGVVTNIGSMTIGTGVTHLRGILNNAGTITQVAGRLDFNDDGSPTLNNLAGGIYEVKIAGDSAFVGNFSNNEQFNNAGTLRRDGANNARLDGVTFGNTGAVEVLSGSLNLNGPVAQLTGTALTGGTWDLRAGGTLLFGGNIVTNNATLLLAGTAPQLDAIATNNGSLTLNGGRDFARAGLFTNNGLLTIGPGSVLSTDTFSQSATGTLAFQIAGASAAAHGQLSVAGSAAFNGTARADVANGFDPAASQTFTLATFGSRTGDFAVFDGLRLGRDLAFERVFDTNELRLNSLTNAADLDVQSITVPPNGISGQTFAFSYTVQNMSAFDATAPSWVDSVYLSLDDKIDPSDKLITRITHTTPVSAGGSYTENVNVALPGALPGDYRVLVLADSRGLVPDPDRDNNFLASIGLVNLDIPTLTDGVAFNGTIANGQELFFRITIPTGKTASIQVGSSTAGVAELYTRLSDVPTRAVFDASDFNPTDTRQQVLQPPGSEGTYYVLLRGRRGRALGKLHPARRCA